MPDTQEVIEIKYIANVDEAITNTKLMLQTTEQVKAELRRLASETGLPMKSLAEGMVKSFRDTWLAAIKDAKAQLAQLKTMPEGAEKEALKSEQASKIREETEAYKRHVAAVKVALSELSTWEKANVQERINAHKKLVAEQKVDTAKLIAAQKEYIAAWKSGTAVMSPEAQKYGAEIQKLKAKIQDLAKTSKTSFAEVGQSLVRSGQANVKDVNQALTELSKTGTGLAGIFSQLGTVGSFFFGSVLGITAISVLRQVINLFKELITAGFDYAKALIRLNISTNILQEKGYNVTLRETYQLITDLNREFPIFTRRSIVEGVGYIQLLSQNLELTNEQMKNMASVSSALAVVLGKDVNDAARELALFLSSGYGEALQRAGILASKGAVMHELLAMGVKTGYNETSAALRAQAGYNVIMRDAIKLLEKAKEIQQDEAYAVDRLNQAWNELKNTVGVRLVPSLAILADIISKRIMPGLQGLAGFISYDLSLAFAKLAQYAAATRLTLELLSKPLDLKNLDQYRKDIDRIFSLEGFEEAQKITREAFLPDIFGELEDSAIGAGSAVEDEAFMIANAVADLYTKIEDATEDFNANMLNLKRDFWRDMEQLDLDALRNVEESWIDYYASAYEIARRMNDDFIKEDIDYAAKVAKTQRELAAQREDIETKYRDRELKDERDFQEKMRRLREDFIMDLEDALRERDARQVLRLIRQFNLDRNRLEREREAQREDRQREYRREIEELEQQRQEKLRVLYEEHMARYAEIKRQEEIELRELEIKHRAELAEIDRRLAQEKEDRKTRYDQQQADLKLQYEERIKKIGEELANEYTLTADLLNKIGAEYTKLYGANGVIQQALDYALAYLSAFVSQYQSMMGGLYFSMPGAEDFGQRFPQQNVTFPGSNVPYNPLPHALGASNMLATSPQILKVGEVPELINITPLNRLRTPSVNAMGDRGGTITLDVWLSPDLEARVVDSTLQEAGNIMLNVQRRR